MIVETNYGSGIQLYKQVDYLNDLIKKKDTISLSESLNIGIRDASQIEGNRRFRHISQKKTFIKLMMNTCKKQILFTPKDLSLKIIKNAWVNTICVIIR